MMGTEFEAWYRQQELSRDNSTFVTCGLWDLADMLPRQCITSDLSIPACLDVAQSGEFVNIKFSYQRQMGVYGRGLPQMLARLGLHFDGRLHSGIDDCLNMVKILESLARQGAVFENNGRPELSASGPRSCYNCTQPGHLSNECSAPRSARSGRGRGTGRGGGRGGGRGAF